MTGETTADGPFRALSATLAATVSLLALLGAAPAGAVDPVRTDLLATTEQAALPRTLFDGYKSEMPQALPRTLAASEAQRYARIFRLQDDGAWGPADKEIRQLTDKRLLGSVLAQRYLSSKYRSRYDELAKWLQAYGDHPEAPRLYRLAVGRKPAAAAAPERPQAGFLGGYGEESSGSDSVYSSSKPRDQDDIRAVVQATSDLRRELKRGHPEGAERALRQIEAKRLLDEVELGIIGAEVAQGYFFDGDDARALKLGIEAARRAGGWQPLASWIAGLAAFRLDRVAEAAKHFETMLESRALGPGQSSAAGFWAARAHLVAGHHDRVSRYLVRAALNRTSFYGLLARRALGVDTPFNWAEPRLTDEDMRQIRALPGGWRALALIQVGERSRAEAELRRLAPGIAPEMMPALLALAARSDMPALSMRLAGKVTGDNPRYDGAAYPIPGWKPEGGFSLDPALLFAIMRQESAFHSQATSGAGARGLMQIMPATAIFIGEGEVKRNDAREQLLEPERNLTLGQRYVQHLLEHPDIQGNLLMAVASYNAGPAAAMKWQRRDHKDDPLLFVESISYGETRAYVQRVVANFWIYQLRMGQPTPTLDAIASGDWPVYTVEKGAAAARID